jgi:hypothetical protein
MPQTVQLPDGSTLDGVPDGTTQQQIIEKLRASGNPNWARMAEAYNSEFSPQRFLTHAIVEPLGVLFSGAVAAPVSGAAGLLAGGAQELMEGKGGMDRAAEVQQNVQDALTIKPQSKEAKAVMGAVGYIPQKIGEYSDKAGQLAADATGSAAVGAAVDTAIQAIPMMLTKGAGEGLTAEEAAAQAAKSAAAAARAAHYVQTKAGMQWQNLSASSKAMMTSIAEDAQNLDHLDPAAVQRTLRAQSQGVPISRGQATRDAAQITREENIRKSDAGKGLREQQAGQDTALYHNLDVLKGQVAPGTKVTRSQQAGPSVQGALRKKMEVLQKDRDAKYEKARRAGELAAPVETNALEAWLAVPANGRNAGFLKSALNDYKQQVAHETGPEKVHSITINDLENIRKEAVAHTLGPRSATTHYAGEAIGVIDRILDESGSTFYKEARAAHRAIKEEFDRQGAIRQMVGTKGATTDRAVALEDTLDRVVIRGSNEDLLKVKKALTEGGTKETQAHGVKAWQDLQAGAIEYLREKAGGKRGIRGEQDQQQFNSTFLDALHDLDNDGKLDTLFGPRIAERVRLLAQTVHDVRTTPSMRISGSDSVPRIMAMLEHASHIPIIGPVGAGAVKGVMKLHAMGREGREAAHAAGNPLQDAAKKAADKARGSRTKRQMAVPAVGGLGAALGTQPDLGEGP